MLLYSYKKWIWSLVVGAVCLYMSFSSFYALITTQIDPQGFKILAFTGIMCLISGIGMIYIGFRDKKFCKKFKYRLDYKYVDADNGEEVDFLWALERFGPRRMKDIEYNEGKKIAKITFDW